MTVEALPEQGLTELGLYIGGARRGARRQALPGDAIEAGMVCINTVRTSWPDAPFGGIKDSGFGSQDGPEGVEAHMITKAIHAV